MSVDRRYPLGAAVTVADLTTDPHPILARLRGAEPVSWLPALDGWLVTRRDLAVAVMRDPATFTVDDPRFSTARVVGPSMLSLDGDAHARHRGPFEAVFRLPATRDRFAGFVSAECDRLIDGFAPAGTAEIRRRFAGPLAVAVVAAALGLDDTDPATVLGWYDAIVGAVSAVTAGRPVDPAATTAFAELRATVTAAATSTGRPSLLRAAAGQASGLDPDAVVSNAAVLMFGGIETTEAMIANLLWHLLGTPGAVDLVRAGPAALAGAVEESLRLEPAAATVDRYATRDVTLGGAAVRRGDLVTVSIAGANRDPAVFADPDRYDVRRPNVRQQLAFAQGPHVCLGMHLARLEARVGVAGLLARLPHLRLDPDRPGAPHGLVFRKPPALHLRWDPVTPAGR
jgi:cytochrome P450